MSTVLTPSQTIRSLPCPEQNRLKTSTARYPEGWTEGLTSEEFLTATKQMLRKKFDTRNKIS